MTDELFEAGAQAAVISPSAYLKDPNYRFEMQLVKAMRWSGPVIGLGHPGEALGIGRILTNEDDWKSAAAKLAEMATYIICIPSSRPGTLWEIDYLLHGGFIRKTTFVMPATPPQGLFRRKPFALKDDWARLVIEARNRGVFFPDYQNENLLFCLGPEHSLRTEKFNLTSYRSLRNGIRRLTKKMDV
ncbi:hypothetical protein [Mesorhizobium sp. M0977]|uniref:hypothetical protein n=1 Tax=Mesorhizobium sp. M0977 TaxID=2957039 RepID=UPI003339A280